MNNQISFLVGALVVCLPALQPSSASAAQVEKSDHIQPMVEPFLMSGKFADGEKALTDHLVKNPNDDQARFGLGVLQFFQGIEHLGRTMGRFGVESRGIGMAENLPFLRFPVANKANPDPVELKDMHEMMAKIIERLEAADNTLSKVKSDDVKLPLRLFQINIDFDGDAQLNADEENFHTIIREYFGRVPTPAPGEKLEDLVVMFDRSDVYWLQAYTHLLRAMGEFMLAYDQSELWDVAAHHVFRNAKVKYDFLLEEKAEWKNETNWFFNYNYIVDVVASIHNMRFKLKDANRVKRAGEHLREMARYSRTMWDSILAEKDNDREWLPSPTQQSVVARARITEQQVEVWREVLAESEKLLNGELLIPFWRGTDSTRGLNLKKFFDQPSDLDIVLWTHGSGAVDYLEKGKVTSPVTWARFQRVFNGDFIGFAAWIN